MNVQIIIIMYEFNINVYMIVGVRPNHISDIIQIYKSKKKQMFIFRLRKSSMVFYMQLNYFFYIFGCLISLNLVKGLEFRL